MVVGSTPAGDSMDDRRIEERRKLSETPDEFKRSPHVRRIKNRTRRYYTDPRSSAESERRTSKAMVTGSNPVGGANDDPKDE